MKTSTVIFDAVTFLQALANSKGPAAACWNNASSGTVSLLVSQAIVDEVAEVLRRPKIATKFGVTEQIIQSFMDKIVRIATSLADIPFQFSFARDPKDEPYLNLAIAAQAKYLVTWDKDLLDLMNENNTEGQSFRLVYADLVILTPPDFLRVIQTT